MSILERIVDWLPSRRARSTDELSDELRTHLDLAIADRIARGESPESASANARREFGNVGLATGMRPLLLDVSPFDPITLMGSIVVIATAMIAASLIPAAAAVRVEPRAALED
jgi:hypothetical protein